MYFEAVCIDRKYFFGFEFSVRSSMRIHTLFSAEGDNRGWELNLKRSLGILVLRLYVTILVEAFCIKCLFEFKMKRSVKYVHWLNNIVDRVGAEDDI